MNCPVCGEKMTSPACACGYDMSRDYEKYPTFAPVPGGRKRLPDLHSQLNDLVRCGGCGGHTFTLNRKTGDLACSGCGRALSAEECKPLTDALGREKAPAQPEVKSPQNLLNVLGQIQQQRAASEAPKTPVQAAVRGPQGLLRVLGQIQKQRTVEPGR